MDFSKNIVLKENYAFLVADADGRVGGGERGIYRRDTRFLSRYEWELEPQMQTLLLVTPTPDRMRSHQSLLGHHQQHLSLEREVQLHGNGLTDRLLLTSTSRKPQEVTLRLHFDGDFADLFEVRGWGRLERDVAREQGEQSARLDYTARDGVCMSAELELSETPEWTDEGAARFVVRLEPGEQKTIEVELLLRDGEDEAERASDYESWRQRFAGLQARPDHEEVVRRAIDDLRALLLFTDQGPFPAAGIPWFVAAFGRDALLTAAMLLPWTPEVAEGTLRYLAAHQGEIVDPYRAEAPGKIMHELRFGELARTGKVPHSPYFGTVDATPLFVVLLGRLYRDTGDLEIVRELRGNWEAALSWMEEWGDLDGDGFLEFTPAEPGKGLNVQSWKDSEDSMSHADGTLAAGALAVAEVQGYAYEAYEAASLFYRDLGEEESAQRWSERASRLKTAFQKAFWLDGLGTYAMALDGEKRPLAVQNSDAGHLLWSGIVPEEYAPRLASTLFSADNWSGWGFRTLGRGEARYNPVSYHNGSVWPHDTVLIAAGLRRYGFVDQAATIREAVFDLANSQPDKRLPELVAGYERIQGVPPIPYPVACRPQAWDAAALIHLLTLLEDEPARS